MIKAIIQAILTPILWLLLATSGLLYFLTQTTLGLQTTVEFVAKIIPGQLHIAEMHGKLLSAFSFNTVSYQYGTQDISIHSLKFQWHPEKLLLGKLDIRQLQIRDIVIRNSGHSDTAFSFEPIKFYLRHVVMHQIAIDNLTYAEDQKPGINFQKIVVQQHHDGFYFYAQSPYGKLLGTLADQWNIYWNFLIPDFSTIVSDSRGYFSSEGTVTGPRLTPTLTSQFQGHQLAFNGQTIDQMTGRMNVTFKPGTLSSLSVQLNGINIQDYTLKKLNLAMLGQITLDTKNITTAFNIVVDNHRYADIVFSMPQDTDINNYLTQPISAKLNLNQTNLDELKKYTPNLTNLHGTLQGSLALSGNFAQPILQGEIDLSNGNTFIPKLGITLDHINLHIIGNNTKQLAYSGSFQSAKGIGQISGNTDFAQTGFPTTIHLQGNNLQAVNLSEYKIEISPTLTVQLADQHLSLEGKIAIPNAEITPKDYSSTVTLPKDVEFVGTKKESTASTLMDITPTMKVNLSLGDHVYIHYENLEATLQGNLTIIKNPASFETAVGELYTTKGTYRAYGKTLQIKQGRLIYAGNILNNPGLNIKAQRHIETVQTGSFSSNQYYAGTQSLNVGVQILGTLNNPIISLFADPSGLSQTDILSYLILGVPHSQTSGQESKTLLSAASVINLGGNAPSQIDAITQKLQSGLGLTELKVESVPTFDPTANNNMGGVVGTQSVVLGKKLTNDLYVHYSVSLFSNTPINILNLRYKLSKRFSIQSETSTIDTGADLLYSIERGD